MVNVTQQRGKIIPDVFVFTMREAHNRSQRVGPKEEKGDNAYTGIYNILGGITECNDAGAGPYTIYVYNIDFQKGPETRLESE